VAPHLCGGLNGYLLFGEPRASVSQVSDSGLHTDKLIKALADADTVGEMLVIACDTLSRCDLIPARHDRAA